MSYECCGRAFNGNGIRNHLDHSYAHRNEIECHWCYRRWPTHAGVARRLHEQEEHWQHCRECSYMCEAASDLEDHMDEEHPPNYCYGCKRRFANLNNLNQHLKSSIHVGKNAKCPWCSQKFTNLTGVCLHLESGKCSSGVNRQKIDQYCREVDGGHIFTNKQIAWHDDDDSDGETMATEASWDGYWYRCYLCGDGFAKLHSLNQHLDSPVHQQKIYHCPRCQRQFIALSGLINHLESESCGAFRFQMTSNGLAFVNQLRIAS